MGKWTKSYTNLDSINKGYEYAVGDWFTIDMVNCAINNTAWLYDNKVTKVSGKGLSTNDYTNAEKSKLAGVEEKAQKNTVTSVNGKTGAVIINASDTSGVSLSTEQKITGLKTFKVKSIYTSTSGITALTLTNMGLFVVTIKYKTNNSDIKTACLLFSTLKSNEIMYPCFEYTSSNLSKITGIRYLRLRYEYSLTNGRLYANLYDSSFNGISSGALITNVDEIIGLTSL